MCPGCHPECFLCCSPGQVISSTVYTKLPSRIFHHRMFPSVCKVLQGVLKSFLQSVLTMFLMMCSKNCCRKCDTLHVSFKFNERTTFVFLRKRAEYRTYCGVYSNNQIMYFNIYFPIVPSCISGPLPGCLHILQAVIPPPTNISSSLSHFNK